MKICVVGLGIIGGSICRALKRVGHTVDGMNRSSKPIEYALKNKIIDNVADDISNYDVVFIALPPKITIEFINTHNFKSNGVVVDICGVKEFIEDEVYSKPRNFYYVGCHPMAGKEVSGIENSSETLFDKASMIITSNSSTNKQALDIVRMLTKDMGFKYTVECSAKTHDKKIAYTSQLAHIVSNAYVKDKEIEGCIGFTGGSFQDMTRIAGVDENVWASLYLLNSKCLVENISTLIDSLNEIKSSIESGNEENLQKILKEGRLCFEEGKNFLKQNDIFVQKNK